MNVLNIPVSDDCIRKLNIGDQICVSGALLCGRDAVLQKIQRLNKGDFYNLTGVRLDGSVMFHTAVSDAGIGPTSSNKIEIESSIIPLSREGVKIHLGKGRISADTVKGLNRYNAVYAIVPPVSALLGSKVISKRVLAYPELGMEALFEIVVKDFPMIVAVANGRNIYDRK